MAYFSRMDTEPVVVLAVNLWDYLSFALAFPHRIPVII